MTHDFISESAVCVGHHYAQTNINNVTKTCSLLQTTGGKDKQTRHEPSYKQLEVKTNKQDMSPPTNNWR
jgi:hypothetical protein